jgi:hypothetical protein
MLSAIETALHARARETLVRRRWWIATLLFVAGLINYFDRTIVSVALPSISARRAWAFCSRPSSGHTL